MNTGVYRTVEEIEAWMSGDDSFLNQKHPSQ